MLAVFAAVVLAISACSHPAERAQQPPLQPKFGAWGVETADMDRTVRPGDDFFDYAVGSWLRKAQIPPDQVYTGVDLAIQDQTDQDLKAIVEQAAAQHAPEGDIAQKVGDFYAAFMDESAVESKGVEPIRPDLVAVDRVTDKSALSVTLAALNRAGATTPFPVWVDIDPNQPTRYVAVLWQGGLSFSNRDYYLMPDQQFVDLRDKFVAHVERLLSLAGYPDAREQARRVLALETKLAQVQWPLEEEGDVQKTRTIMSRADVEKLAAGAPLRAVFDALSLPPTTDFQVGMPEVTVKTAKLFNTEPLDAWKAYLRYQVLSNYGPYLAKAFDDELFGFYDRELAGKKEQNPRWKRGVDLVSSSLSDAVGQLYVAKQFPPDKRQQVFELVDNLRKAYAERISRAGWMAPETQRQAQAKLTAMLPKIGYPDIWKSYESVDISAVDLVADVKSADAWAWNDYIDKLGKPIDRGEWTIAPQVNNAFYGSSLNDLTFTAAILQAPYFDPAADLAVNYGEIGATIGHEMSHGFDDQGRQFDASGALRDWWAPADAERYNREAAKLTAQFDTYEPLPGLHINGQRTLGENIADLAGLRIAYDAYRSALGGHEAPIVDGLTGDQRFFIAYAESWKSIYRDEEARDRLLSDVHSPPKYRVNGMVRNIDEWYPAFDVKEGDALYLKPEERVRIW